jgi:hypothetical protein
VLIPACCGVDEVKRHLTLAEPGWRFLSSLGAVDDCAACHAVGRVRQLCSDAQPAMATS